MIKREYPPRKDDLQQDVVDHIVALTLQSLIADDLLNDVIGVLTLDITTGILQHSDNQIVQDRRHKVTETGNGLKIPPARTTYTVISSINASRHFWTIRQPN